MGNSDSTTVKQAHKHVHKQPKTQNKVKHDDMAEYEEKASPHAQKMKKEVEEEIKKKTAEFQQLYDAAQKSINGDKSIPNLVNNYAKLRTYDPPRLETIDEFVEQMKEGWEAIMAHLPNIKQYCGEKGKEKAATMEKIHIDYWRLLLETRSKIGLIMAQCKIQKRTVSTLLDILEEGSKTKLSEDDRMAHNDCIRILTKWIRTNDIQQLIDKWTKMNDRLQTENEEWTALAKEAAKYWYKVAKKIAIIAGITILIIGVIVGVAAIIVATAGTGAVVIGAGVAAAVAATDTAVAAGISTGVAVTIAISTAVAVGVGVTGTALAVKELHNYKQNVVKVKNNINILSEKLEKMLNMGNKMEDELRKIKSKEDKIATELDYMEKSESMRLIKPALKQIMEYLNEYMRQGEVVMKTIEEAAKKYVDV